MTKKIAIFPNNYYWKYIVNVIIFFLEIFKLTIAVGVCFIAGIIKEPWLGKIRSDLLLILVVVSLCLILFEVVNLRSKNIFNETTVKNKGVIRDRQTQHTTDNLNIKTPLFLGRFKKIVSFLLIFLTASGSAIAVGNGSEFYLAKQQILSKNVGEIEKLGEHFIVGYWDFEEVKTLVEKRAIGGIFITQRNAYNKTAEAIRQEIAYLQAIRSLQGLSPLWIATDQEGGSISRMSPPLTKFSRLADVVDREENIDNKRSEIIEYATKKGKELADVGVNLNFAPVVDLNKGIINPEDKYSRIFDRAISSDKEVVTKVALWYCDSLAKLNVRCTLKHFPGLGRVKTDTHLAEAKLDTSITELSMDDWLPFRTIMNISDAFVMLSHVKLTALDEQNPVSFSNKVVKNLIRNTWNYRGVLITDDFCMQAVFGSKDGIKIATVKAINAGVDLILISHDPTQYYPAMQALLMAERKGNVDNEMLQESKARLEQNKKVLLTN